MMAHKILFSCISAYHPQLQAEILLVHDDVVNESTLHKDKYYNNL